LTQGGEIIYLVPKLCQELNFPKGSQAILRIISNPESGASRLTKNSHYNFTPRTSISVHSKVNN
jgi:hypothetical protein